MIDMLSLSLFLSLILIFISFTFLFFYSPGLFNSIFIFILTACDVTLFCNFFLDVRTEIANGQSHADSGFVCLLAQVAAHDWPTVWWHMLLAMLTLIAGYHRRTDAAQQPARRSSVCRNSMITRLPTARDGEVCWQISNNPSASVLQ